MLQNCWIQKRIFSFQGVPSALLASSAVVCENGGCGPCYLSSAVLARRAEQRRDEAPPMPTHPQRNAAVALAKVWGSVKNRPFRGVFQ